MSFVVVGNFFEAGLACDIGDLRFRGERGSFTARFASAGVAWDSRVRFRFGVVRDARLVFARCAFVFVFKAKGKRKKKISVGKVLCDII